MQLEHHLSQVHDQLRATAALGDERTREIADALAAAATPSVRLAVLHALGEAADEITAALLDFPGSPSVSVRLDGEHVAVDVHAAASGTDAEETRRDEGDPSARISLRLTESLKSDIDDAAERDGVSVNTWLVRAATAALRPGPFGGGWGLAGTGFGAGFDRDWFGGAGGPGGPRRNRRDEHNITGWING